VLFNERQRKQDHRSADKLGHTVLPFGLLYVAVHQSAAEPGHDERHHQDGDGGQHARQGGTAGVESKWRGQTALWIRVGGGGRTSVWTC